MFAKHRRDNTNNMAVQVRTLHSGRAAGCHLISFSRPAQSKFEVQPPPEHHVVEQHTHVLYCTKSKFEVQPPPEHHFVEQQTHDCSVTQEGGACSACFAYCMLHKLQMFYNLNKYCTNYKNARFAQGAPICKIYPHCTTLHKLQLLDLNLLCLRPVQPRQY